MDTKRRSLRLDDDFFLLKISPKTNFSRSETASSVAPRFGMSCLFDVRCLASIDYFKSTLKTLHFNKAFNSLDI
jgi:hypothetical protein